MQLGKPIMIMCGIAGREEKEREILVHASILFLYLGCRLPAFFYLSTVSRSNLGERNMAELSGRLARDFSGIFGL